MLTHKKKMHSDQIGDNVMGEVDEVTTDDNEANIEEDVESREVEALMSNYEEEEEEEKEEEVV